MNKTSIETYAKKTWRKVKKNIDKYTPKEY